MKKCLCAFLISTLVVFIFPGIVYARWNGGHDVMGAMGARTSWYFAEGCSRDGFHTWLCLYNPEQSKSTDINISYYLENGTTITDEVTMAAHTRLTVNVGEKCGPGHDIATRVTSKLPIVAERPMYFDHNGIAGAHIAMGADCQHRHWYFAEGCTQPGFEEWLCILNSEDSVSNIRIDYLIEGSVPISESISVNPHTRFTRNVGDVVGFGKNVSIRISGATENDTVIAERPMYFIYQGKWKGGHNAMGVNELSKTWYFGEGCTRDGFSTWLTLQNAGTSQAEVVTTYMMSTGENVEKAYVLGPQTRKTINVAEEVGLNRDVSMTVKSGVPIAAERPMYFNYHGAWDGGTDSFGAISMNRETLFAEGCSRTGFETWVCIQNPNPYAIDLDISFSKADGVVDHKALNVLANSRATVSANEVVGPEQDFSIKVTSDNEFVAERPMYCDYSYEIKHWGVEDTDDELQIAYGQGLEFPQYAVIEKRSSFIRMLHRKDAMWGTSIMLLPVIWERGKEGPTQGAPVDLGVTIMNADLVITFTGMIAGLPVSGSIRLSPPEKNRLEAVVTVNVQGDMKLCYKPNEAFKLVFLGSMHISDSVWDTRMAYVGSEEYGIPGDGWIVDPVVTGDMFGLKGGTSSWKRNCPTIEIRLDRDMPITGWVTPSSRATDQNVGFWIGANNIVHSYQYTAVAKD